ncbi:unnamed protein product [Linum trigynum]|uniref:DUF7950 domain-containing protein n=1 Tax=Linum trigynum TaxID=586398 RepID=A0AAV2F030_9ROSI
MDGGGGDGYRLMNFASGRVQEEEPTIINRMMLRFRPIAPKPAAGAGSGSSAARLVPKVRTKRKYVRVRAAAPRKKKSTKKNNNNDHRNSRVGGDGGAAADLGFVQLPATLQLLPEASKLDRHRSDVKISDPVPTLPVEDNSNSAKNNRGSSDDSYGAAVLDPETARARGGADDNQPDDAQIPPDRSQAGRRRRLRILRGQASPQGGDGGAAADLGFVQLPATLQLLPEASKLDRHRSDVKISDPVPTLPVEDNSNSAKNNRGSSDDSYGAAVLDPETAEVETWVTAEGVTGGCVDVAEGQGLLGIRMMDLQDDTCPAFVSDGKDKVRWVNQAYREMVGAAAGEKGGSGNKVVVRLVVAEKLRPYFQGCPAFSCWVGVRFRDNSNNNGKWSNVRFPCDVWKMEEEGWYGWRLDTKVALKLGL